MANRKYSYMLQEKRYQELDEIYNQALRRVSLLVRLKSAIFYPGPKWQLFL